MGLMFVFSDSNLDSDNSITFKVSSKSGIPALKSVIPLNKSCNGGVNFREATAIVAKKGIISRKVLGLLLEIRGNHPIEKIKVIPKGSINDLGNSGKVSAFHK